MQNSTNIAFEFESTSTIQEKNAYYLEIITKRESDIY